MWLPVQDSGRNQVNTYMRSLTSRTFHTQQQIRDLWLYEPALFLLVSFCIYAVFAGLHAWIRENSFSIFSLSGYAYFNYLADAFLHGQFHLRLIPADTHDLVYFNQNYFLYWPPFPAVLLLPFVLLFGVATSDIFFTLVIASLNVALTFVFLRQLNQRQIFQISRQNQIFLTVFFAFGTVHFTLASLGRVWFTAQLIGYLCILITYMITISIENRWAFFLAGLGIAAATLTRNHLIFMGIWPAYYLLTRFSKRGLRWLFTSSLLGLAPIILGLIFLGYYNFARFGNPLEVGIEYHQMAQLFQNDYSVYGAFNLHYLPTNFYYQYIFYPFPLSQQSLMGGSLFLLSPLFLGAFFAFKRRLDLSVILLTVTILVTMLPILLLMGTGWVQFGPRYTLDFTVALLLLTGIGIGKWKPRTIFLLMLISILHYLTGVVLLINM